MDVRYRVTVAPVRGDSVIMEVFETRSDADAYWAQVNDEGDGNILSALPFDTVVASFEEFHEGTWVLLSRRVVAR